MATNYAGPRKVFTSREEVEALTFDEARDVICDARDLLRAELDDDVEHMHWLDDCGDYLFAAIDNYHMLWTYYWENDGDKEAVIARVKDFLLSPQDGLFPYGGSDGEIRLTIVPFMTEEGE